MTSLNIHHTFSIFFTVGVEQAHFSWEAVRIIREKIPGNFWLLHTCFASRVKNLFSVVEPSLL